LPAIIQRRDCARIPCHLVTEGVKALPSIGRVLDPRLDLLGSAQMALSEVDTFQRFSDLLQGGLERV
jgi:hypothetical protein